jgi:hypothetical protein
MADTPININAATMSFQLQAEQDCKDMDDAPFADTLPMDDTESWTASPQTDNECLTFRRMLPKLGPKPPPSST